MSEEQKEKIKAIVMRHYEDLDGERAVEVFSSLTSQAFFGEWISPKDGCDTLKNIIEDIFAEL